MTGIPMKVQFAGLKELQASLKELEPKLQRRVLRRVLRKQSKLVLAEIKSTMPKSGGDDIHLADLLKARAGKSRKGYMSDGVAFPSREELGISPDDKYYWPYALEYGHAAAGRGVSSGKRRKKSAPKDVPAHPHIRRAWDSKETLMAASIEADTFRELEKMWTSKK